MKTIKKKKIFWQFSFLVGFFLINQLFALSAFGTTLSAQISANPSSGPAPLNGVDLTATVSGTATGPITYKFDCTNDGSWEKIETSNETSFTAVDLCNYQNPGAYVAKIEVIREGLAFQGVTAIVVKTSSSLSVNLSANPTSGPAPLNNVDLIAQVSGNVSDPITYQFDCTSDGTWEKIETTNATSFTAVDLCSYPNPGQYLAKVLVKRGDLTFQGTTSINVFKKEGEKILQVDKKARNLSRGETIFADSVTAAPLDVIEFQIKVSNLSLNKLTNVKVKDILPSLMNYRGNLLIGGQNSNQDITSGINLGEIGPQKNIVLTFQAALMNSNNFSLLTTNLTNRALVFGDNFSESDELKIMVNKSTPTTILTGSFNVWLFSLIAAFLTLFGISYLFLFRYYFISKFLPEAFKNRIERQFLKAREKALAKRKKID
jgi:uncharacterized repeat protein (TIGR01451 family)